MSDIRAFDAARDRDAVVRIWREVGWIDSSDEQAAALDTFFSIGHANVGLVDGEAECAVHWTPGSIHHGRVPLPLCAVTGVTTSRIARKLGLASRMTATALMEGAESGAAVAALGMFEQGFYDRLGFGTGSYDHRLSFDPSTLRVDVPYRRPVRLTVDDWRDMHAAMVRRRVSHGSVNLDPPEVVQTELTWIANLFALGYRDDGGQLTHFVAGEAKGENGPYRVTWIAYQDGHQLLELLRLLRELGDQVMSLVMVEPAEIQLQDLIHSPGFQKDRTRGSTHEASHRATAWCQLRVLDLAAVVAAVDTGRPEVSFALTLHDPLADRSGAPWPGIGGDYTVTLGRPSGVETGHRAGLPVLEAGVGALTRLLFGVRPATSLALTDRLSGPPELLAELDRVLCMPRPHFGWDF